MKRCRRILLWVRFGLFVATSALAVVDHYGGTRRSSIVLPQSPGRHFFFDHAHAGIRTYSAQFPFSQLSSSDQNALQPSGLPPGASLSGAAFQDGNPARALIYVGHGAAVR
jgi:hypothetical protein